MWMNVNKCTKCNKCNEKTTTGTINQRQLEWETIFFPPKKKIKKICIETGETDVVVILVITWSLYSSLSRLWDVVVVVFFLVAQNDGNESFTQWQQCKLTSMFWANWRSVSANECIYFLAANIYILLSCV